MWIRNVSLIAVLCVLVGCGGGAAMDDATTDGSTTDGEADDGDDQSARMLRAPAVAAADGVSDGIGMHSSALRPAAGFGYLPNFSQVCGLFTFSIAAVPRDVGVARATLHVYRDAPVGNPSAMVATIVLDHMDCGGGFPADLCIRPPISFAFSGPLASGQDVVAGWRTVDVSAQVRADLSAGRLTSQFRVRIQWPAFLVRTTLPPPQGYFTFGDAEARMNGGRDPYIEIQVR